MQKVLSKLFMSGVACLLLFSNCKYPHRVKIKDPKQLNFRINEKAVTVFPYSGSGGGYAFVDSAKGVNSTIITALNFKHDGTCRIVYYAVNSHGRSDTMYNVGGKYTLRGRNKLVAEIYRIRKNKYAAFEIWHFKIRKDGLKCYFFNWRGAPLFVFDNRIFKAVE